MNTKINTHILITSLLDYTYPMLVLEQHPDYENWLIDSSLHLVRYNEGLGVEKLSFLSNWMASELLDCKRILLNSNSKLLNQFAQEKIIELIIDLLDQNNYLITHLDEFYIEGKQMYNKSHFLHISYIYIDMIEKSRYSI